VIKLEAGGQLYHAGDWSRHEFRESAIAMKAHYPH
jgi:hypothetical protein